MSEAWFSCKIVSWFNVMIILRSILKMYFRCRLRSSSFLRWWYCFRCGSPHNKFGKATTYKKSWVKLNWRSNSVWFVLLECKSMIAMSMTQDQDWVCCSPDNSLRRICNRLQAIRVYHIAGRIMSVSVCVIPTAMQQRMYSQLYV